MQAESAENGNQMVGNGSQVRKPKSCRGLPANATTWLALAGTLRQDFDIRRTHFVHQRARYAECASAYGNTQRLLTARHSQHSLPTGGPSSVSSPKMGYECSLMIFLQFNSSDALE